MLQVCRCSPSAQPKKSVRQKRFSPVLEEQLRLLIYEHQTYEYRRLWAVVRFRLGVLVNRKRTFRILRDRKWLVHQRLCTPRPRVKGSVSITSRSKHRWAMDLTHVAS
ncbi:MAG: IS3 family transposase, partial [Planctomycetes bacterium]|nr:IS3 family transposase [Planctomycetota bacterium]